LAVNIIKIKDTQPVKNLVEGGGPNFSL
jgi:hypothetical protein